MDTYGYREYLQSLGNQAHYICNIQKLLDLEHEFNINLDDYIPYNQDYSKVPELESVLSEEKLYDEPLWFSINSYMRYRLSDFDIEKYKQKNNIKSVCSEYLTFNGSRSELKSKLSVFMSEEDCDLFISKFKDYAKNLEDEEFVKETISYPKSEPGMMQLLIGTVNYNINIKALTIITIALLLDINLTLGFASAALALIGFNGQAIAKVDVSEGEKCLIMEAMQSENRIIDENVFSMWNQKCIRCDLDCKYKIDEKCTMEKSDIRSVLDGLCDKNIFKKIKNYYKYNF